MVDILHRVGIKAPLAEVYRAVATPVGVAGWWTVETTGKSELGGPMEFRFHGGGGADAQIVALDPAGHVRWEVTDGPEEWVGTHVDWQLDQRGEHTVVQFAHEGWREPVEFMRHCSTKWATFLLSLRDYVETGSGRPAPDDAVIGDWR